MIIDNERIQTALSNILPTYYNQVVEENALPCIMIYEIGNNDDNVSCETMGYSNITFNIKIVGKFIKDISGYVEDVDKTMRSLGYKRTSSNDLIDVDVIQKVLTYRALGFENFMEV